MSKTTPISHSNYINMWVKFPIFPIKKNKLLLENANKNKIIIQVHTQSTKLIKERVCECALSSVSLNIFFNWGTKKLIFTINTTTLLFLCVFQ